MLISLAVMSVIAALGYTTFFSIREAAELGRSRQERIRGVRRFMDTLDAELSACVLTVDDDMTQFESERIEMDDGKVSRLAFATISPQVYHELVRRGEIIRVEYLVEPGEEREGPSSLKKRVWYNTFSDAIEPVEYVVLEDVTAFQFRFRSAGTWSDTWQSKESRKLPETIELTFRTGRRSYRGIFNVLIEDQ
jgi:type II secretion system protein J